MPADIAERRGAKQCITEGVEGDISIGMGGDTLPVWYANAAKHDMVSGSEGMHVHALSNAVLHGLVLFLSFS
jgi:hypothetical protein